MKNIKKNQNHVFQFINLDIDTTTGLNILSHYQKVNRRLSYQNSNEKINKTRQNKYKNVC